MVKRNYAPGMHGQKGNSRLSPFGQQLRQKQIAVKSYRLLESQFANYYAKAKQMAGDTGENLITLLEKRLDNVVYRLQIAKSRDAARQIINHGHIMVNGKKVDIASFQVRNGDQIQVAPKYLETKSIQESLKKINAKDIPSWLTFVDQKIAQAKVTGQPASADIQKAIDAAMIVEYYSR